MFEGETENVALARRLPALLLDATSDPFEIAHPEVEFIPSPLETTVFRGPGEFASAVRDIHHIFDERQFEIREVRDLGDTVLLFTRVQARMRKSGVPLDAPAGFLIRIEDGKVRYCKVFPDKEATLAAAGLSE